MSIDDILDLAAKVLDEAGRGWMSYPELRRRMVAADPRCDESSYLRLDRDPRTLSVLMRRDKRFTRGKGKVSLAYLG
jgi:hypothetical protein